MNNKTLLLTLSFTLGTLFTNAQSLSGFQWGEGMGTPDLSWTAQVGAKTYPKGKIFQAADQMEWVHRMNSIRSRAEEIVLTELVYN